MKMKTNETRKIAIYQNIKYPGCTPMAHDADSWIEKDPEYARVSEIVEVEFPALEIVDMVGLQVSCIDHQIEELKAEFGKQINTLNAKKQDLLALTNDSQ
jgi:hypothetical protein